MRSFLASLDYESVAALVLFWSLAIGIVAGPSADDGREGDVAVVTSEGDPGLDCCGW